MRSYKFPPTPDLPPVVGGTSPGGFGPAKDIGVFFECKEMM